MTSHNCLHLNTLTFALVQTCMLNATSVEMCCCMRILTHYTYMFAQLRHAFHKHNRLHRNMYVTPPLCVICLAAALGCLQTIAIRHCAQLSYSSVATNNIQAVTCQSQPFVLGTRTMQALVVLLLLVVCSTQGISLLCVCV